MKKNLFYNFILLTLFVCSLGLSKAEPVKVAVIDTGFDFQSTWGSRTNDDGLLLTRPKLCKTGHRSFTDDKTLHDNHGHGTHVAGLIGTYAKAANYCLVILKITNIHHTSLSSIVSAIEHAIDINVDIINHSGGGVGAAIVEKIAVTKALDRGIIYVSAAGNDGRALEHYVFKFFLGLPVFISAKTATVSFIEKYGYFMSSYDPRVIAVGGIGKNGKIMTNSNHGPVVRYYERGESVLSILPNKQYGRLSGTSQATAIKTGKIISNWYR